VIANNAQMKHFSNSSLRQFISIRATVAGLVAFTTQTIMKTRNKSRNHLPILLIVALIAIAPATRGQTWTGGDGAASNIDDPANWDTLPAFDGSQTPTFASGGTVATIDANVSFYGLNFSAANNFSVASGGGTLTNGAGGIAVANAHTYTIACPLEIAADQIWPINSGASLTISGVIDDGEAGFGVLKSLTGTLTLNGANTYGGPTTINGGTAYFNSIRMVGGGSSALGAPTNAANGTINMGGSATVYYTGGTATSDRILNLTGAVTFRTDTASGPLTLTGGITGTGTLAFRNGQTITETGVIATGGSSLTRTSSGSLVLHNAANSFGFVDIYQGILSVDSIADVGVPSSFGAGTHFSMGQATTLGTLQFTGANGGECNRPIAITGTSSSGGGIIENTVSGQTLTMSGTVDTASGSVAPAFQLIGAGNGVMSGTIQNTVGSLSLTKSGAGIWTLSGTDTYTGTTTVSAGTLLVNGSIGSNAVSVGASGTLGGSGMIGGAVNVVAGGKLTPGGIASLGTLTLTNKLTLNGNNLSFLLDNPSVAGSNYDQIAISNNLVLNGANHILFSSYSGSISAGAYTLMTYAGLTGSGTLTFADGSTTSGSLSLTVGPTSVILNVGADVSDSFLKWKGNLSGLWDTTTQNWASGASPASYTEGTNVVFDDSAVNFSITNGTASPGSVTFQNSANAYSVAANIKGSGSVSLNGSAQVSLVGTNSYSGGTTLNSGALAIGSATALGTGPLTVAGNSTLAALATLTMSNSVVLNAIPAFSLSTNTLTLAGNITGGALNGPLNLSGGTLVLSGTNFIAANSSAAQQFRIPGGALKLAGGSTTLSNVALYPTGGQVSILDGTHYFVGSVANFTGFNVAATLTITGGAVHTSYFSLGYGGAGAPATFNMNGGYFDTTTSPLGTGTLLFAFNTPATYVTTLNLNGGTILTAGIQESGTSAPAANNIINLNGGKLQAAGASANFLSASGLGMTVNVSSNGAVFDTAGFNITVTNALLDGGSGGGLTKSGAGVLDLTGISSYTGPSTVGGGTLLVDGALAGGAVAVGAGTTLGGTGILGGATTVQSGGTIAAGTPVLDTNVIASSAFGTLTVNNNLTLNPGAGALFQLNKTNTPAVNGYLAVTGNQSITASTLTVVNFGPALAVGDRFNLLSQPTGGFTTVNLPAGYTWANNLATDGSIQVLAVGSATPAPTNITYSTSGNQLVLSWPAGQGWQLQAQTNNLASGLTANWFDVTGATSPYTISVNPANATVFYRLKH
jgi:fibronectin-binding autotransporter adhesin